MLMKKTVSTGSSISLVFQTQIKSLPPWNVPGRHKTFSLPWTKTSYLLLSLHLEMTDAGWQPLNTTVLGGRPGLYFQASHGADHIIPAQGWLLIRKLREALTTQNPPFEARQDVGWGDHINREICLEPVRYTAISESFTSKTPMAEFWQLQKSILLTEYFPGQRQKEKNWERLIKVWL